jgi:hypothetical protein
MDAIQFLRREHQKAQAAFVDPEDVSWRTKLKPVHASLEIHIREEEQDIFPRISKVWNEDKLEHAGADMKAMKATKLTLTTVR